MKNCFLIVFLIFLSVQTLQAAEPPASPLNTPNMATPVKEENVDPAAFAAWENGTEKPIASDPNDKLPPLGSVLWTDRNRSRKGVDFGASTVPGPRYCRIGFKTPIAAGSVLVQGGGALSVLKPTAAYPGALNDESQWLPAQRLDDGNPTTAEVEGSNYAIWTLPPNTTTRALRFSHTPEATDKIFAGRLGGVFVFSERLVNLAPQSTVVTARNVVKAKLLTNADFDYWKAWDNDAKDDTPLVSTQDPQIVTLLWPAPVRLSGLDALWAGFSAAQVQIYAGPADRHPRNAQAADWQTVKTFSGIKNGYGSTLWPNRLDFDQTVTTRAVRLLITAPAGKTHPYVDDKIMGGRRIWLGELMALSPLGAAPLEAVNFPAADDDDHPPIPVRFTLQQAGFVTLVIEDPTGKRIRNLVSETYFPAGPNTAWWDGTDDWGRDVDATQHGLYKIPAHFVAPGNYRVRGLVHAKITPRYEFSVYNPGSPPWKTADTTGNWLTNHTPPQGALFLSGDRAPGGKPLVYLGSYVSEGGSGLAWVDLDGRKQGGRGWVGGIWTGAPYLAADAGPKALPNVFAYVASVWTVKGAPKMELRLNGLTTGNDKPIASYQYETTNTKSAEEIGGLAVHDGTVVVSLPLQKRLLFVDAAAGKVLGSAPLDAPHGLAFDARGALLALSGTKLLRFEKGQLPLATPETLVSSGLEDPNQITLDPQGNIYISDRGQSHQVKVFDSKGKFLRAIGKPGAPQAGPYDPLHMNNPAGLAVDSRQQLWVTENDFLPKRVSLWGTDGKFIKAFYGPGKYGGGGALDPTDKTKFYYADDSRGALEFKLDWQKGESQVVNVLYRRQTADFPLALRNAAPETVLYHDGKRYFTNCYNSSPTSGKNLAYLFLEQGGVARPIAAVGRANEWDLFAGLDYQKLLPPNIDLKSQKAKDQASFVWSDTNGDYRVQPSEVTIQAGDASGITIMSDLSFCIARFGDKALRLSPTSFSAQGVPSYDLSKAQTLATGVLGQASSGGNQLLTTSGGWTAITLGIKPFSNLSLSGAKNGEVKWSYPSLWPGLHASHRAPAPSQPGELIGTTRLLGGWVEAKGSDTGPLWGVNANMGTVYLFTADGLFVATIFKDSRQGKSWTMPVAQRDLDLGELTLNDENFWPTISGSPDGNVYLVDGNRMALVRLDGLNTLRRVPESDLKISAADLKSAQSYLVASEADRQKDSMTGPLEVTLGGKPPVVDGLLDDWKGASCVDIDKSGVKANFNASTKPYDITAAVRIAGDRLYAAWKTGDDKLLRNTGELPTAPFKTGGALDLMLATDPKANPKRTQPATGDLRLLVTQVKGKTMAVLYRAVVPGTKEPVPFSSPWRTITLDRVDDVSAQTELAGKSGNYEISIPLSVLGLQPVPGDSIQGDIGVLRGDGTQTMARVYWSNKATGITADVPSEAELTPQLWGQIQFKAAAN